MTNMTTPLLQLQNIDTSMARDAGAFRRQHPRKLRRDRLLIRRQCQRQKHDHEGHSWPGQSVLGTVFFAGRDITGLPTPKVIRLGIGSKSIAAPHFRQHDGARELTDGRLQTQR